MESRPSTELALAQVRKEYEDILKTKLPDAGRYALLIRLGQIHSLEGSYGKALDYYKEAQGLMPNTADAYYAIGNAYYDLVLFESVLDRTHRFDATEPRITVKSRDKVQGLISAVLQQYEIGHRHKTLQDLYPKAPYPLSFRSMVQWREKQARNFLNDNVQQILLHRNEVLKLAPWAAEFSPQDKAGTASLPRRPATERPLPAIMREIEPKLTAMTKVISAHTLLQKKAAEYRQKNKRGLEDLKQRTAKDPKDSIAMFALGYIYMIQMDYNLSLKQYMKSCDVLPTVLDCWAGLARLLYNMAGSYMMAKDLCKPLPPACQPDDSAHKVTMAAEEILEKGTGKPALNKRDRAGGILQAVTTPGALASLRDNIRTTLKRD